MAERKKIGLFFESYRTLPAYVIYMANIIRTLCLVDDTKKPHIVLLHLHDSPLDEIKALNYPYIDFYCLKDVYRNPVKRMVNKAARSVSGKNVMPFTDNTFPADLDCIFPYNNRIESDYVKRKIIWKPDFQEFHYPVFFSLDILRANQEYLERISKEGVHLVLSSNDALRDYKRYFPANNSITHLVKFTSFLPDFSKSDIEGLRNTFKIAGRYYIVCNQFWPHKNHLLVLKAIYCLKTAGRLNDLIVVFTGKTGSVRDKELFEKLKYFCSVHGIEEHVRFTGFISREDQLCLMKNSISVIQPSLFEGWSTVIEDAKAMGHFVLASDISVNREQVAVNCAFFNPNDYRSLATLMTDYSFQQPVIYDYRQEIERFKSDLENLFGL
jgi:glycosyltransferase involved in cell wall biosynthesis